MHWGSGQFSWCCAVIDAHVMKCIVFDYLSCLSPFFSFILVFLSPTECSKAARAVKTQLETIDARKEKDEARAEMRRLQALRENDMAAYASLVQDTKNGRLKFLLSETDSYIASINKMIQDQRVVTAEDGAAAAERAEGAEEGDTTGELASW